MDLNVFFPVGSATALTWDESVAKAICAICPAKRRCGDWALEVAPEFGVFGGMNPVDWRQRRSEVIKARQVDRQFPITTTRTTTRPT